MTSLEIRCLRRPLDAAIVYQCVVWINEWWLSEKNLHGRPLWLLEAGQSTEAAQLSIGQPSQTIPTSSTIGISSLPSEKREPEVLNHIHEGSTEKKLGGEADDTEGNDEHKKKEDYSTDF